MINAIIEEPTEPAEVEAMEMFMAQSPANRLMAIVYWAEGRDGTPGLSTAAAALGSARSEAKAAAARINGAKGGRPRKAK